MAFLSVRVRLDPRLVDFACLALALYCTAADLARRTVARPRGAIPGRSWQPLLRNLLWTAGALMLVMDPTSPERWLASAGRLGGGTVAALLGAGPQIDWGLPTELELLEDPLGLLEQSGRQGGSQPSSGGSSLSMPRSALTNLAVFAAASAAALVYRLLVLLPRVLRYARLPWLRPLGRAGPPAGPPSRVLVVHGSVGAGHKRAAEAIAEGLRERHPQLQVTLVDIVDFAGPLFHAVYKTGYLKLAEQSAGSHMVGYFFERSNQARPGWFKRVVQELFLLDFIEYLYVQKPDVIVNTHFLSCEIVAGLRRRRMLHIPQVTVVTDYDAHAFWANSPTEAFFVGQAGAACNLTHINDAIDRSSVRVSGIPTMPAFSRAPGRQQCQKRLGLRGDGRPIVLITASGAKFGGRPSVFTLYEQALTVQEPLEIVVITGRQKDLRTQLALIPVPAHHAVKLEGFTDAMHEYMRASDIIVTKPGGLTTAESLIMGLAIVVVNPYPGQEMRNTDTLLEEGVAVKCNDLYMLGHKLQQLVGDRARLSRMKAAAARLGRADAVFRICDFIAAGDYGYIDYAADRKRRADDTAGASAAKRPRA